VLISLALILLLALSLGSLFEKMKLPKLLGMLFTGIILGPFLLDLIDESLLDISTELRKVALVIILLRAGLSLKLNELREVGITALLLSFVPATLEIIGIAIVGPMLFDITLLEALILGSVLAAVSPAVIVPKMIALIEEKRGTAKKIPQMVLAAASVDDVIVIVLFTSFLTMYEKNQFDFGSLITIPISIALGALIGALLGGALIWLFKRIHMRDSVKVLIILSFGFILLYMEDYFMISGLIGVMSLGLMISYRYEILASRLQLKFSKIWVFAEILLFVLIGAALNLDGLKSIWFLVLLMVVFGLLFRIVGVFIASIKSKLNQKERLFVGFAYLPKATVQAAIGAIPLQQGLEAGDLILSAAVFAILVTAPVGAFLIDLTKKKLLQQM